MTTVMVVMMAAMLLSFAILGHQKGGGEGHMEEARIKQPATLYQTGYGASTDLSGGRGRGAEVADISN